MAKAPKASKAVATAKPENQISTVNVFESHANAGMENIDPSRDLTIPRLTLLQALSPQLSKSKTEFIKGASAGQICDTASQKVFDDEITFLPVNFKVQWLEWAPRSTGKGLVAIHETNACLSKTERNERGQNLTGEGNLIVETATFLGFNVTDGMRKCFISLSSTQRKKAKRWLDLSTAERLQGANGEFIPPLFYRTYKLSVIEESNNQGSWFGWKIERDKSIPELGEPGTKMYHEAVKFREAIVKGAVKADLESLDEGHSNDEGTM